MGLCQSSQFVVYGVVLDADELYNQIQRQQFAKMDALLKSEVDDESDLFDLAAHLAHKQMTLVEQDNVSWFCKSVPRLVLYRTAHVVDECMREMSRNPDNATCKARLTLWMEIHASELEKHKEELSMTYKKVYVLNIMMLRAISLSATHSTLVESCGK